MQRAMPPSSFRGSDMASTSVGGRVDDTPLPFDENISRVAYLNRERHCPGEPSTSESTENGITTVSKWRMKDRMKTGCVALVLCLNFNVDPPDLVRLPDTSRVECWLEPSTMVPKRAVEAVAKNLQAQYERWHAKARYKLLVDPAAEDVKKLCQSCRKAAKHERVLFHYNGHGVPRPTVNGEIWLFNQNYTQYIPIPVYDLEAWLGSPSIYVFDCSAAGRAASAFTNYMSQPQDWGQPTPVMRDTIILAACDANESLPQRPDLPADTFTACLTTPIRTALRWFVPRSSYKSKLDMDIFDKIPGKQGDRKTMLGELNWIFTAITDSIAWDVLPRDLFRRLFRQDLLVASLFRNFLLAERIMRSLDCTPCSHPRLPSTHEHHMWSAWDRAAENCMSQLSRKEEDEFQPSPFFSEQLTAFEEWLKYATEASLPPQQLPIVLQVLLSQSHRYTALELLGKFLDKGSWAVDLALSVGIFPYVLKLLQTNVPDLRELLVFIWTKILAWDQSVQADLVKDGGHMYFIKFLKSEEASMECKTMALFVLSAIVDKHPKGQLACLTAGLLEDCQKYLKGAENRSFKRWLCLCLAKLWDGHYEAQRSAFQNNILSSILPLLQDGEPEVRATAVYALGTLIIVNRDEVDGGLDDASEYDDRLAKEREIACGVWQLHNDGSVLVRRELGIALVRLAHAHKHPFKSAAEAYMKPATILKQPLKALHPSASLPSIAIQGSQRASRISPRILYPPVVGGSGGGVAGTGDGSGTGAMMVFGGEPSSDPGKDPVAVRGLQLVRPTHRMGQTDLQSQENNLMGCVPIDAGAGRMRPVGEIPMSAGASPPNGTTPPSLALHGSLGSESSCRSDDGLRDNNCVGLGIAIGESARPADLEERQVYVHATSAVYSLAKDPAPNISNTARQTLRTLGVEQKDLDDGAGGGGGYGALSRVSSVTTQHGGSTASLTLSGNISRSASWIGSATGVGSPLRVQTIPSNLSVYSVGGGMRRVISSLDFAPFSSRDGSNATVRVSAEIGNVTGSSSSPARAMLERQGSGSLSYLNYGGQLVCGGKYMGAMSPGALKYTAGPSERDESHDIPESPLFQWSCKSFRKPKLHTDDSDASSLIEKNEKTAKRYIEKWSNASVKCPYDPIFFLNVETDSRALVMHPFEDILCSADSHGTISIWNYFDGARTHSFKNQIGQEKGVSKLCFVNEFGPNCLLLAGSPDGCVRVWKNFMEGGEEHLAAAWQVLRGHRIGARGNSAVIDWQQLGGQLFASGDTSFLYVWELQEEKMNKEVHTDANSAVTALTASQVSPHHAMAGCQDGSIRLFDIRQKRVTFAMKPNSHRVVGLGYLSGNRDFEIVSATANGELKFFDIRGALNQTMKPSCMTVEAHSGGNLSALAVHRHAPVISTGSTDRSIKVFGKDGKTIAKPRYHLLVLAQKIGPVACLGFHPYKHLMAMGAKDQYISIFGDPKNLLDV